jgi:hypothetical protein
VLLLTVGYSLLFLTGGYSVLQHLLKAYLEALGSVVLAQFFRYKALEGGLEGVKELAKSPEICRQLAVAGWNPCLLLVLQLSA